MAALSMVKIAPRNGGTLVVGVVCRISGCDGQQEASLDDQVERAKEFIEYHWTGPVEYKIISTTAKGEQLDRPELAEIEGYLRGRTLDFLIVEDLSRLVRGGEAVKLIGLGVDNGTRTVAINDGIDTADSHWEQDALSASAENVKHNNGTSMKLKTKMMNRFKKEDAAYQRPIAGYDVPKGAKKWRDWQRRERDTPTIEEGAELLFHELNGQAVADFFNSIGYPVGPYSRRKKKEGEKKWDGALALSFFRNTLLSGRPMRGHKSTTKHYGSGRRVSVINPRGPQYVDRPQLAHLDPIWHDELIARLKAANANTGHPKVNGVHPLTGVRRLDSRCPGRHSRCWYCGREYVWGANGISENLMCNGSRQGKCWRSFGFDGALAARRLVKVIVEELSGLDGIDAQYSAIVHAALEAADDGLGERWRQLQKEEERLARERQNVQATILKCGPMDITAELMQEIDGRSRRLILDRRELEGLANIRPILPVSLPDLRSSIDRTIDDLSRESYEFGKLMRKLVPEFYVFLVRLCDGGDLYPRARIRLTLAANIVGADRVPGLVDLLNRVRIIDLFEEPAMRERIRRDSVRMARENPSWTYKQIAQNLSEPASGTSVGHALAFDRRLQALGFSDPYVLVHEPPEDYTKLRRHKNPKYRFEPLDGYVRPTL